MNYVHDDGSDETAPMDNLTRVFAAHTLGTGMNNYIKMCMCMVKNWPSTCTCIFRIVSAYLH